MITKKVKQSFGNEVKTLWRGRPVSNLMKTLILKTEEIFLEKLRLDVLGVALKINTV